MRAGLSNCGFTNFKKKMGMKDFYSVDYLCTFGKCTLMSLIQFFTSYDLDPKHILSCLFDIVLFILKIAKLTSTMKVMIDGGVPTGR